MLLKVESHATEDYCGLKDTVFLIHFTVQSLKTAVKKIKMSYGHMGGGGYKNFKIVTYKMLIEVICYVRIQLHGYQVQETKKAKSFKKAAV